MAESNHCSRHEERHNQIQTVYTKQLIRDCFKRYLRLS